MNKHSVIELTSLLDIILIFLFALMLNLSASGQSLQAENQTLKDEKAALQADVQKLQNQVDDEQFSHAREKQTLNKLTQGIIQFLGINANDLQLLINESNNTNTSGVCDLLTQLTDKSQIAKELWKHEVMTKRFYFIDVGLRYSDNQLFINGTTTSVTIHHEELNNSLQRQQKKEQIKDVIEAVINERQGGVGLVLLTLSLLDQDVYQYAYELVWESIKEVQEKYGTERMFITEYTLLQ